MVVVMYVEERLYYSKVSCKWVGIIYVDNKFWWGLFEYVLSVLLDF